MKHVIALALMPVKPSNMIKFDLQRSSFRIVHTRFVIADKYYTDGNIFPLALRYRSSHALKI